MGNVCRVGWMGKIVFYYTYVYRTCELAGIQSASDQPHATDSCVHLFSTSSILLHTATDHRRRRVTSARDWNGRACVVIFLAFNWLVDRPPVPRFAYVKET